MNIALIAHDNRKELMVQNCTISSFLLSWDMRAMFMKDSFLYLIRSRGTRSPWRRFAMLR